MDSLAPGDPINIQYTSGTTGSPKGATLTHRNLLNNGYSHRAHQARSRRTTVHTGAVLSLLWLVLGNLGWTTHGAMMVIPAKASIPGDARGDRKECCTSLYGVPTMFIAILGQPDIGDRDLSSLRTGIMAGATCPMELMKRCVNELNMSELAIAYGMTETSPVSCQDLYRRRP